MNKLKKILLICLVAICTFACAAAVACSSSQNWRAPVGGVVDDGSIDANNPQGDLPFYYPEGVNPSDYDDKDNAYNISTVSMGGLPLDGVRITIKQAGEKIIEGISINGGATFGIPLDNYDIEYSDLPLGYREDPTGTVKHLTPTTTKVRTAFISSVLSGNVPLGKSYRLGDIMYNFSVTDADGNMMVLTQLLQNKRAVVLNFWASWCAPCRQEFPALNAAYDNYKDSVEVIALSIESSDSATYIKNEIKDKSGYHFFMAPDTPGLSNHFDTSAIPVTVIIDRYGVISYYRAEGEPNQLVWEELFRTYTADDYEQNIQQGEGSGGSSSQADPVAPPEDFEGMATDSALNQAFLDASMEGTSLTYYAPAPDTRDGKYNWPFHVGDSDPDGAYITPSNLGVDSTWSIIYTDIELEADQSLSVDVKVKTDTDDVLYIILNNSAELSFTFSGDGAWRTVELFSATRHTNINICITYNKNNIVSVDNEFVGLRNLKITNHDYSSNEPLDVRTEAVQVIDDTPVYPTVYKASDGLYRIQEGAQQSENDSILFTDVLSESLWSDLHLKNFKLYFTEDSQSYEVKKSLYLISFWHADFGNGSATDFKYGKEETSTIVDNYWIQDGNDYMAPVDESLATALKAFARYAKDHIAEYEGKDNFNEDTTWLELCSYYRTLGGAHTAEGHNCLAHYNSGLGKTFNFAIELKQDEPYTVDLYRGQRKNRAGGLFYKFTAPEDGVYQFESFREYETADPIDPKIIIWPVGSDAYNDTPLLVQEDCRGAERFLDNADNRYTNNFKAVIYLTKGTTVYPQLTTGAGDISEVVDQYLSSNIDLTYEVEITYLGATKHVLTIASIDGTWESTTKYSAVDVVLIKDFDQQIWHHQLDDGVTIGSEMYIDFLNSNYMSPNSSIEQALDSNYFKLDEYDYTPIMNSYLAEAKAKDPEDPTYGMLTATDQLVQILSMAIQENSDDGDGLETYAWEGFAYYWHYYGPTPWEALPE